MPKSNVFAEGMGISGKGTSGFAKSTLPDVCKTPSPGGPIPIPYPVIISKSKDLKKGAKSVRIFKKPVCKMGCNYSKAKGDQPGSLKGIVSNKVGDKATFIMGSFTVFAEGKMACRHGDKMLMNAGNTVCLSGATEYAKGKFYKSSNCLVGSKKNITEECSNRGGQAHHILPDEYLRHQKSDPDYDKNTTELKKRTHETFPSYEDGCCICVGGYTSAKTHDKSKLDTKKVNDYCETNEKASYAMTVGHAIMHEATDKAMLGKTSFQDLYKAGIDGIQKAIDDAPGMCIIDKECGAEAKKCLAQIYKDAAKANPPVYAKPRKSGARDKALDGMRGK